MRSRSDLALLIVAAGSIAGCSDGGGGGGGEGTPWTLPPAPPSVERKCRDVAQVVDLSVMCPTRWPDRGDARPRLKLLGSGGSTYSLDVQNGFGSGHVFHILLGGQLKEFQPGFKRAGAALGVTTRRVTVPVLGGGRYVSELPSRRIGTTDVHDSKAAILQAPPYPRGGIHGGHVIVMWNEGGYGYLVSAHGERLSRRAVRAAALEMARSSEPVGG